MDLAALPPPANEAEAHGRAARPGRAATAEVKSLIGMGYHGTHTPPVILRNVLENPGWYTAYTPYQAEIAQGRLEALVNFQTMVCDLTGLPVANASLLDEATAAAEAMRHGACRARAANPTRCWSRPTCIRRRCAVLRVPRRAARLSRWWLRRCRPGRGHRRREAVRAWCCNIPAPPAQLRDIAPEIAAVQAAGGLAIVAADLLSLCLLTPPGEMGADIVVGSSQRFGVPMGYGGPHAAFMAVKDALQAADAGPPGRRLASMPPARRRCASPCRRASSTSAARRRRRNICTAQVLLAVMAGMYAVWHGPEGLRAHRAARGLAGAAAGRRGARRPASPCVHERFFDTIAIDAGDAGAGAARRRADAGFNLRRSWRRRRRHRAGRDGDARRTGAALHRALRGAGRGGDARRGLGRHPRRRWSGAAPSSPRRCSPRTAPSTRCCAT